MLLSVWHASQRLFLPIQRNWMSYAIMGWLHKLLAWYPSATLQARHHWVHRRIRYTQTCFVNCYSFVLFTMVFFVLLLSLDWTFIQGLIRLLSTCASGSLLAAKTLLLLGISGTLKDILSGSSLIAGTSVSPALSRPADQVITSIMYYYAAGASIITSFYHFLCDSIRKSISDQSI